MPHKKGFSLIESAIVLAVVGLVISGIWVAAATVRENMLINKTVQGTGIIANNIRQLYSGGMRVPTSGSATQLCDKFLSPLPDGYGEGTSYYCDATDPFGRGFYVDYYYNGTGTAQTSILYYGINKSRCIALVSAMASMANLKWIQSSSGQYFARPANMSDMDTKCLATQSLTFSFYLY